MFAPGRRIGFYGSGAGLVGSIYSLTGSLQLTLIQGGPELMDGRGYMVGVSIATIVAESWEPGARVADVARRHDATRWQIYKWRQLAVSVRLAIFRILAICL